MKYFCFSEGRGDPNNHPDLVQEQHSPHLRHHHADHRRGDRDRRHSSENRRQEDHRRVRQHLHSLRDLDQQLQHGSRNGLRQQKQKQFQQQIMACANFHLFLFPDVDLTLAALSLSNVAILNYFFFYLKPVNVTCLWRMRNTFHYTTL